MRASAASVISTAVSRFVRIASAICQAGESGVSEPWNHPNRSIPGGGNTSKTGHPPRPAILTPPAAAGPKPREGSPRLLPAVICGDGPDRRSCRRTDEMDLRFRAAGTSLPPLYASGAWNYVHTERRATGVAPGGAEAPRWLRCQRRSCEAPRHECAHSPLRSAKSGEPKPRYPAGADGLLHIPGDFGGFGA